MKKLALLFFISALIAPVAKSQILSPEELKEIHSLKEVKEITSKLNETGYKEGYSWDDTVVGRISNWQFQNKPGEFSDFTVRRIVDKTGHAETRYWISNIYHYKQFINSLSKEKYKVEGATIISDKIYTVLKKKNISFLIGEHLNANNKIYYEVIIKEDKA
ncbi:MAG: hypothetical protein COW65_17405 [Cytophagales bacterium CG18_big_fil_WC_8_21_14_2_50_42_9]|nr:MAG: hypothetical protein COW65_17405 [Cytophagales bacterium CG18_big_fil_WC_8_21_14_2_50_42_9]